MVTGVPSPILLRLVEGLWIKTAWFIDRTIIFLRAGETPFGPKKTDGSRSNWSWQTGITRSTLCHQLFPVSSPDPALHAPSENFPTGRGAEGLGTRLNFPWSLHAMKAGFRMGLVAVTASSVLFCFPAFIIISLPLALWIPWLYQYDHITVLRLLLYTVYSKQYISVLTLLTLASHTTH